MQQQTAELEKLTDTVAKFTAVISRRLPDDVDLLIESIGSREANEPFHPAQVGLLGRALAQRHAVVAHACLDDLEGAMVVDLPAQRCGVFGRAALEQESARVVVQPESQGAR